MGCVLESERESLRAQFTERRRIDAVFQFSRGVLQGYRSTYGLTAAKSASDPTAITLWLDQEGAIIGRSSGTC